MDFTFIKSVVVGPVVRLILNAVGGFLAAHGVSTGSAEEVVTAVVVFVLTIVWSLFQRKADTLATPATSPVAAKLVDSVAASK